MSEATATTGVALPPEASKAHSRLGAAGRVRPAGTVAGRRVSAENLALARLPAPLGDKVFGGLVDVVGHRVDVAGRLSLAHGHVGQLPAPQVRPAHCRRLRSMDGEGVCVVQAVGKTMELYAHGTDAPTATPTMPSEHRSAMRAPNRAHSRARKTDRVGPVEAKAQVSAAEATR